MNALPDWVPGRTRVCVLGDRPLPPCAATVGTYDGLHRGHQAILARLLQTAKARSLESALLTFEPTPQEHFRGAAAPARLSSLIDKAALIEQLCPELTRLVVLPFDQAVADMPAPDFIRRILRDAMHVQYLTVGADFRFGRNRQGDAALLEAEAASGFFAFEPAPLLEDGGERISSTRVRDALANGELEAAEQLLGHPVEMHASVAAGDQRGRTLGFPTANLDFPHDPPLRGVFAVTAVHAGHAHAGVANVGTRPTVDGLRLLIEVHLLDFEGDLYGQPLAVRFRRRLRAERRFDSVDQLRLQIGRDIEAAREYFADAR